MSERARPSRRSLLPWLLALVIPALLLHFFDIRALEARLRASDWRWVALAAALNLVLLTLARAGRFSLLLVAVPRPAPATKALAGPPPRAPQLVSPMCAARTLNLVLPALAGEALRAVQIHRRFGFPVEGVVAAIAMESLLEGITLAFPAALIATLSFTGVLGNAPGFIFPLAILGLVIATAMAAIALFHEKIERRLARPSPGARGRLRDRVRTALQGFHGTLRGLNRPAVWLKALAWTGWIMVVDLAMIALCLKAVGIALSPLSWFLVLLGINAAIAIPTPGNVGTLEAGAVFILQAFGVDPHQALAFALLYHAAHLLPVLLLGAFTLPRELRFKRLGSPSDMLVQPDRHG